MYKGMAKPMNNPLFEFLSANGFDDKGRRLVQIWNASNEFWEKDHSFIQWVFPLKEKSRFNPDAPLLTDELIEMLKGNDFAMVSMEISFLRALRFLQLPNTETPFWAKAGNHNILRVSRILKCLSLLSMNERTDYLWSQLSPLEGLVGEKSFAFWKEAASK